MTLPVPSGAGSVVCEPRSADDARSAMLVGAATSVRRYVVMSIDDLPETRPRPARLSMRAFFADLGDELFSLDRGLPWTFSRLCVQPGPAIRDFIEWREPRFTRPLRYLLVCLALATLALHLSGIDTQMLGGIEEGFLGASPQDAGQQAKGLVAAFSRLDVILPLAWLPATAMAVNRVYGDARINLAESFVLGVYVLAQICLVLALLMVSIELLNDGNASSTILLLVLLPPVYFAWVCAGYFSRAPRPVLRALGASFVAFLVFCILALALLFATLLVHPWWQATA